MYDGRSGRNIEAVADASFRLTRVVRGYQPVYCLPDALIAWRRNTLFRADLELCHFEPICTLPIRAARVARFASPMLTRLLRFEIRSSVLIDDNTLLLAQRDLIFALTLSTGEWRIDFQIPNGRRLLSLSAVTQRDGSRAACFGEYLHNVDQSAVGIWRRDRAGEWSRSAEFPPGAVDHIHNIVETRDGRVWVLVGDMEDRPGIWRSDSALETLEPVATGAQEYRACWIWQAPDGTCHYATDSNIERNRLMRLAPGSDGFEHGEPLAGSSIHAGLSNNYMAFATSLEPGYFTGNTLRAITTRRPGAAFIGNCAHIHVIKDGRLETVFSARMDGWPLTLGQFPNFYFPAGAMPDDRFYAFGRSVRGYDGACLMFERTD
jgi:hypothetical protein